MDLFTSLTDDQLALLGCFAAVMTSTMLMSLSYYLGPASRASRHAPRPLPHVERLRSQSAEDDARRRAA